MPDPRRPTAGPNRSCIGQDKSTENITAQQRERLGPQAHVIEDLMMGPSNVALATISQHKNHYTTQSTKPTLRTSELKAHTTPEYRHEVTARHQDQQSIIHPGVELHQSGNDTYKAPDTSSTTMT